MDNMVKYVKYGVILLSTLIVSSIVVFFVLKNGEDKRSFYDDRQFFKDANEKAEPYGNLFSGEQYNCKEEKQGGVFFDFKEEEESPRKDFNINDINENFTAILEEAKKYKKMYDEVQQLFKETK